MINLSHYGYEQSASLNLTNPNKFHNQHLHEILKWFILKLPRHPGRCYKKDYPNEDFWSPDDVYFTYYKGRGQLNKGDRMINFYQKEPEIDINNIDWGDDDEPLY